MIANRELYKIRAFIIDVEEIAEKLMDKVTEEQLKYIETEVCIIASEIDRLAGTTNIISENVDKVLKTTIERNLTIRNALNEIVRCIEIIDNNAMVEREEIKKLDKIADGTLLYKLKQIEKNLNVSRLGGRLSTSSAIAMKQIENIIINSSKQIDMLLDKNSRKLSRKVARRLKGIVIEQEIMDKDEIKWVQDKFDECYELIDEVLEAYFQKHIEEDKGKAELTREEIEDIVSLREKVTKLSFKDISIAEVDVEEVAEEIEDLEEFYEEEESTEEKNYEEFDPLIDGVRLGVGYITYS